MMTISSKKKMTIVLKHLFSTLSMSIISIIPLNYFLEMNPISASGGELLKLYTTDLTELAKTRKLDPVIGTLF